MIVARRLVVWAGAHAWLGWLLCLPILWKAAVWATDNTPPFQLLAQAVVVSGPPGGEVAFEAHVRRDLERECSVSYSRHIIDARGFRHDFESEPGYLSANGLRQMDNDMGGQLRLVVNIPKAAAVGPAVYSAELRYVCNPLHSMFPIRAQLALPFDVLPAVPRAEAQP